MLNWKNIFKSWYGVPVLILVVLSISWVLTSFIPGLSQYYEIRKLRKSVKEFYSQYAEDKYGGKTPEETYNMFIEALKKEDVELASKYFVAEKQEQWRKALEEYKSSSLLSDFMLETEKNKFFRHTLYKPNSPCEKIRTAKTAKS